MPDGAIEAHLHRRGYARVAGVDEAGRGPLAGPVVVAAVILGPCWPAETPLADSKRLDEAARETAWTAIRRGALAWRAVAVSPAVIDRENILRATLGGMATAVRRLRPVPDYVLVDGNRLPALELPAEALVKGDSRCASIAAASIVAKVLRDRVMRVYGRRYPQWGFERHKGYGTEAHCEAIRRHGPSPIHRRSFRVRGWAWPTERVSDAGANQLPLAISSD